MLPVEGVDWSQPSTFISDRGGFPQNMRHLATEMCKRPGKSYYGSLAIADATQIMGLGVLEMSGGLKYLVRASKAKLEVYNTATGVWDSISNTDFTGGDEDFFSFTTVSESNMFVISNNNDKIRKWLGSGNAAALGGNPPFAKYMCYLSPYLLLAHVTQGDIYPWKVQWCDTDAPEVWSGGNAGSKLLSDEPSAIQNIMKLNEYAAVYKENSLWLARKVETSDIFHIDCMKTGIGLASPRALADVEGNHYFMGLNDFHVFNGIREEPIGKAVRDRVFSTVDRFRIKRCFAIHIKNLWEVWFFILTTGQSWPTEVYKYNYRLGFWYYDTCASITSAIAWKKISTQSWNDDTPGSWDEALDTWDAADVVQDWEEVIFGHSSGHTSKLDYSTTNDLGIAVAGVFETKDYTADTLEFLKRWLQLDLWAHGSYGAKLYIDYSTDEGTTWMNIPYSSSQAYLTLTERNQLFRIYFDTVSEHIRFRFRNTESNEMFYIQDYYPYYLSREEARK